LLVLTTVVQIFENFKYHRTFIAGPHDAALEFSANIGKWQLKGVDLIKFAETGEMIEFEVMIRRSRRWRRSARNWRPDWTATGPVEGAGCRPKGNSADFRRFWRRHQGPARLRQRGPCGKDRPPVEAVSADSQYPGTLP
jgi:hypothetical protein